MKRVPRHRHGPTDPPFRKAARTVRGFTLIELIGVLAIMGMLAAVLTPSLAQRVSRTKAAADDAEIAAIGDALLMYATIHQSIPGSGTWASKAASMLGMSTAQILYAIPEDTSTARVYLIHPSFLPRTGGGGIGDPIWTQDAEGTMQVANAQVPLLSVHRAGLTLPVSSGAAATTTAFEHIWDWNNDPATDSPPIGWPSAWEGNGEYLHVRRVNFEPLFRRATFSNTQYPDKTPWFQIGDATATRMSGGPTFDSWYVVNTFIRVHADNGGLASAGALQLSHTLQGGANFVYASDRWQTP